MRKKRYDYINILIIQIYLIFFSVYIISYYDVRNCSLLKIQAYDRLQIAEC